ncbi:hypothetical protein P3T76_008971 [Phytophthora citrophthora]|uniref:Uncharacterized protein n=1 Tax=Phytophthora citrophthora TaxID=4793 RepID=A0AAD9GIW6_9STRA|nr:hypothetical protein P3T76_008971 [Phytophthora citrophthora]
MKPSVCLKNPMNFGEGFQSGDGQVHVVPKGAVADVSMATEVIGDVLEERMNTIFQERDGKRKRKVYSLSELDMVEEQRILKKLRLDVE